jgi:hypothetical protein
MGNYRLLINMPLLLRVLKEATSVGAVSFLCNKAELAVLATLD